MDARWKAAYKGSIVVKIHTVGLVSPLGEVMAKLRHIAIQVPDLEKAAAMKAPSA